MELEGFFPPINRKNYEKQPFEPIRKKFFTDRLMGEIKCLLTIYGVPITVGGRGVLEDQEGKLKELNRLAEQENKDSGEVEAGWFDRLGRAQTSQ